jgi:hypothetical protein
VSGRIFLHSAEVGRGTCRNQAIALIEATLPLSPSGLLGRRFSYLCGTVARASLAYEPRSLHSQPYARQRPSGVLAVGTVGSGELQAGQRLAKPGLSGFNSNSSAQTVQIFVGKAIHAP